MKRWTATLAIIAMIGAVLAGIATLGSTVGAQGQGDGAGQCPSDASIKASSNGTFEGIVVAFHNDMTDVEVTAPSGADVTVYAFGGMETAHAGEPLFLGTVSAGDTVLFDDPLTKDGTAQQISHICLGTTTAQVTETTVTETTEQPTTTTAEEVDGAEATTTTAAAEVAGVTVEQQPQPDARQQPEPEQDVQPAVPAQPQEAEPRFTG